MKILHVVYSSAIFGAEKLVITIGQEFIKKGHDVAISLINKDGLLANECLKNNIRVFEHSKNLLTFPFSLLKTIKKFNPDVIHAHDYRASFGVAFLRAVYLLKIPFISHIHAIHPEIEQHSVDSKISKMIFKQSNLVLAVSEIVSKQLSSLLRDSDKVVTLLNPLMVNKIVSQSEIKENNRSVDVLFVGRLAKEKQPELFIEVAKQMPDKKFVMVGDGQLRNHIENIKPKNVEMIGFTNDVYKYYLNSKTLLLPSFYEGFGLVVLESMYYGCIPITTRCGGPEEIIEDGYNGYFVENSVRDAVNKLTFVLENYDKIFPKFVEYSRETTEKFSIDSYIQKLEELYQRIGVWNYGC